MPKKLPVVLSPEEVTQLIGRRPTCGTERCCLLYATGLRRAEVAHLKVSDIDRSLMLIHVHQGKGSRDRELPLPRRCSKRYASTGGLQRSSRGCTCSRPAKSRTEQEKPISDKAVWTRVS